MAASCFTISQRLSTTVYFLLDQETCPVDELLLEKLFTHINVLSLKQSELLLNIDVNRVVKSLAAPRKDARLLAFGFSLFGVLGAIENNVKEDLIRLLVKNWLKRVKNPNCAAIIRSSGLQMLTKLIANGCVREIIADTGVVEIVVNMLEDSSLFVCSEAQNFLKEFLSMSLEDLTSTKSKNVAENVLKTILQNLQLESTLFFTSCLNLFKKVFQKENLMVKHRNEIEHYLLNLLLNSEDKFVVEKLSEILILTSFKNDENSVTDVLKYLSKLGFVDVALKLCCNLSSRSDSIKVKTKLQNFALNVIEIQRKIENKSDKNVTTVTAILLQMDFNKMDAEYNTRCLAYFCDLLEESSHQQPKLTIPLLESIFTILSLLITNHELCSRAVTSVTQIIKSRSSPNSITIKTLNILSRMVLRFPRDIGANLILNDIIDSLSHLLFHPSWEIQDSVLEFVGHVAKVTEESSQLQQLFLSHDLHSRVLEKLFSADESFVRASATIALLELSNIRLFWEKLIEINTEEKIINRILELTANDTEAVVRRSTSRVIKEWYQNSYIRPNWKRQFQFSMYKASSDLDWEVKLVALEFWEKLLNDVECETGLTAFDTEKLQSVIDRLDELGFCKSLISSLDDCDSSVKLKSATILKRIKGKIIDSNLQFPKSNPKTQSQIDQMDVDEPNFLIPMDEKIMEEILNTRDCDAITHTLNDLKMANSAVICRETETVEMGTNEFLSRLMNLDLDSAINEAETNADIYEDNLELLVDDIAAKWENKNVIQDCY